MDAMFRHIRTGRLYRILCRYDQVGADVDRPRACCQLVISANPRVYADLTRTFLLKNLEPVALRTP